MFSEPLPVDIFVKLRIHDHRIHVITQGWLIDPEILEAVIINQFEEIGIFSIEPLLAETCFDTMLDWLKYSPHISMLVKKSEDEDRARKARKRVRGEV